MYRSKLISTVAGFAGFAAAAPAYAATPSTAVPIRPSTATLVAAVLAMDTGLTSASASATASSAAADGKSETSATQAVASSTVGAAAAQAPSIWVDPARRAFGNGTPESHLTTYAGYYHASDGYADRYIGGAFMDSQLGTTGLHADILYVDREENAAYGAFGLSQLIEGFGRVKLMAGTSTHKQNIVPKLFLSAGIEVHPATQVIVRSAVAYRKFDHGRSQINPSLQFARYFGGDAVGYFVAQADGSLFINNTGKTGWSVGGGVTHVRTNGWRFGAALHRGYMTYDAVTGTNIHSYTYGGGPNIGFRFSGGKEVFFRSDLTRTRFYTVSGAIVGFKLAL